MTIRLLDLYEGQGIRLGALEFLYELMRERDPEINISHSTLPTFEQHRQFVTRRPYRCWFLIKREPLDWVGYVSATHQNEIGVVISKAYRGYGYGPAAIRQLMRDRDPFALFFSQVV